ncbi:short-chain fatty acid transporter [Puniceibacterium sp. IMCC21224]|uniref:short-chain fatty acid transporter n=1 Tax=Puniceibacterium sp. IMCC21224 TaxID=1618204 RepID=UPI00064E0AF2|nr:TIGR00366 family protein [Puniceibacterium sp. IMCC21224]KMK69075.1 short chain fatty acids transporter [Puniceibacterium sp. IMCC21224]
MNTINRGLVRMFDRYMPDPLILAVVLTMLVFLAGMLLEAQSPTAMAEAWYGGFFKLHAFAMQMTLTLVTGYAIALSPAFRRLVDKIAALATTPAKAVILVTLCTLVANWINWGVGLVIGAILARELVSRVEGVDYRLLIAGAYSGFMVWHGGLSGAATLIMATEGNFLQEAAGGLIPVRQTIFSGVNLTITVAVSAVVIATLHFAGKGIDSPVGFKPAHTEVVVEEVEATPVPSSRLERSRVLGLLTALLGLGTAVWYFASGGGLNLDAVIFVLIFAGILLHGSLRTYLRVVTEGTSNATGVIIQFPFYAGIMGMMASSGMSSDIATYFTQFATETTLPLLTFLSAGLLNIFVPSGGGQWAIQGPIVIESAQALGASVPKSIVGFIWGDAWTNLIQPFWALPALAIAGLRAKDIMGFCALVLVTTGVTISVILLAFGMLT